MAFPTTLNEMKQRGYVWLNDSECKGCGEKIMWFRTPNGKKIPMNPMTGGDSEAVAHWATCDNPPERKK